MLERETGFAYTETTPGRARKGSDMTSSGLQKLAFALLMALILYATVTAAGA